MTEASDDTEVHIVLINDEEQYSIWRQDLPIPLGWKQVGSPGSEAECVAYVDQVWTDMRPASLRALQR